MPAWKTGLPRRARGREGQKPAPQHGESACILTHVFLMAALTQQAAQWRVQGPGRPCKCARTGGIGRGDRVAQRTAREGHEGHELRGWAGAELTPAFAAMDAACPLRAATRGFHAGKTYANACAHRARMRFTHFGCLAGATETGGKEGGGLGRVRGRESDRVRAPRASCCRAAHHSLQAPVAAEASPGRVSDAAVKDITLHSSAHRHAQEMTAQGDPHTTQRRSQADGREGRRE